MSTDLHNQAIASVLRARVSALLISNHIPEATVKVLSISVRTSVNNSCRDADPSPMIESRNRCGSCQVLYKAKAFIDLVEMAGNGVHLDVVIR